ncbi:cobalt ECF transporter T component CbiQ [Aeribacillus composti]|uniref:Cobalt ECF transporter T component CbiQ n=1 Tax=Aeribacillus composti TaxID=1868734 RepID=A0ABY9W9U2_9BACI|nr:cobalt ECF transporter T component CbiQ [Aeribacillus composti]WNF31600.1 cobalt ECF transporter T component CbiQ [Aeribacillus composti]
MLLIDKYAYFNGLRNVHPVEKITLSLCLLLFILIAKAPLVSLFAFIVLSTFIVVVARIPLSYYMKLLAIPMFFLFSGIVTILISFTDGQTFNSDVIWSTHIGDWQIFISKESLNRSVNLVFMVLSSVSCLYFLILTTPLTAILQVLRKLKLPPLFIELITLTYRFIFVFLEESVTIYQSQSSRLGYITIRQGMKSLGLLISVLFLKVFERTKQLTIAMNSRGYEEEILFFDQSYRYSSVNWFTIAIIFAGMMIIYVQFGGIL